MKIGIITIIDYCNYGNRLQNYATQEIITTCDCEVKTIINPLSFQDMKYVQGNYLKKIKNYVKNLLFISRILDYIKLKKMSLLEKIKLKKFKSFTNKNIHMINLALNILYNKKINSQSFDYFIVGSDQVWNPKIGRANWIDFLQFAPPEKRIAYAVSIGLDEIPKEREEQFKKYVSGMKYISVREQKAKEIIEELTDKKVDVVLDPTLMLSAEQWSKISIKPNIDIPKKYILLYFLGSISHTRMSYIKEYAKKYAYDILDLNNLKDNENNIYIADPSEWIYLIANCQCLFTDSFHGCVFSIIHHRDFYVFHRIKRDGSDAGMFSRIETLTSMFKLEDRIQEENQYQYKLSITDEEFSYVDSVIEYERERTYKLLKGAMSNDKG